MKMIDTFGRDVNYLRVSVTDRCDLRCTYCMPERMKFLPRPDLLTLEELAQISHHFIDRGIKKLRISGGEPLVRRDIMEFLKDVSKRLKNDLTELTLTTNGTLLDKHADTLASLGIKRINISLDSLDQTIFKKLTRRDSLSAVLCGIEAAKSAGLHIKINTVLLPENINHIDEMVTWAHAQGYDMSLIEIMPMGQTDEDRRKQFIPIQAAFDKLTERYTLTPEIRVDKLAGPSRYHKIEETKGRIGFISPLTNNFCANCNRIRLTCTGRIYMCLGQEEYMDLRGILRSRGDLDRAINTALKNKPKAHDFVISDRPSIQRHMSVTGG